MGELKKVYEKYKHLDGPLSLRPPWLKEDCTFETQMLTDFWEAIKAYNTRIPPATAGNTLKDNICSLGGCKLKVVSSDEGTSHYEVVSPKSVDVEKLRKAMCRAETKYFKVPIDKRPCKELFVATAIKEAMDKGEV